jgi:flagella basal body P-ring formation protein FlgA
MRTVAILMIFASWARAACVAVPSDKILARDLSAAVPLFQALDPEATIGFSPFPGIERVLSSRDLLLAARRYGLAFPSGEPAPSVCIERIVRALSIEEVRAALLSALDTPGARGAVNGQVSLEIMAFSNKLFPPGRLSFQMPALNKAPGNNPQTPVIWPGKLLYDDRQSLSVWAKVRISVDREIFVAKETIVKGAVIQAEQIVTTRVPQFPSSESPASGSAIAGKVARRAITAGQRIAPEALEDPRDVMRGETVHVKVVDGAATITLDAVAQASGNKGESIVVHNPSSGKSFRAVIEDRGRVIVIPTPGFMPMSSL